MPAKDTHPNKRSLNDIIHWSPIRLVDRMFFTRHLGIMLKGGLSLSDALATLSRQAEKPRLRKIISDLKKKIEAGISFHAALSNHKKVFGGVYLHMIEVGEMSGKLDMVLDVLAVQMEKDNTLRNKVKGALMYPSVVTFAMLAIGLVMFIFVVPQITSLYADANVELPLPTRILIFVNNLILNNIWIFLIFGVLFVVALIQLFRSQPGKWFFHGLFLHIPFFGAVIKKVNLARFSRLMHSLLKTDVPIDQSFRLLAGTLGNVRYRDFLNQVSSKLRTGKSVVEILEKRPDLFPPVVTQMVAVGEGSGTLDIMMFEVAQFYEEEVANVLNNLASVIEPLLILVLGVVAGGVAIAVVMPIYSLVNQ